MAEEMVAIGCRLPNGYKLEVGFSVSQEGRGGAPFAMFSKNADYQRCVLKGANQHSLIRDETGKPFAVKPSQINRPAVINQIPKAFWERWMKEHSDKTGKPTAWVVTSGQIFVVPPRADSATIKAVSIDAQAKGGNIFEPINPNEIMKIEDHTISRVPKEED
jgi:hypothetical protein